MEYLTTVQVAELKGCSERHARRLCQNGKLECDTTTNALNKRKEYRVPLPALSEKEQRKWANQQSKKLGLEPLKKPSKKAENLDPRQITLADLSRDQRDEVAIWSKIVQEWQETRERNLKRYSKSEIDEMFVAAQRLKYPDLAISIDILYRKYKAYKENDLDGLIDHRGGHNKGKTSIPPHIWDYFKWIYLTENRNTVSGCYKTTIEWTKEFYPEDMADIPSERTFRRQVERLPFYITEFMRNGDKAANDNVVPYIIRLYDDLHVNDVWVADNHTLDFITLGENGRQHRLYVTAYLDAKTGLLTGWNITDNPCMDSTVLALRHGILRCGRPKLIYVDNGSEFLTHDFGGKGHRKSWNEGDQPPTILDGLGIRMVNALPKNADAKAIERMFSTLKNQFSRQVVTFCGGTVVERKESLKYLLKKGILPTDQQIRAAFDIYINSVYNLAPYGGKERRFKGMTRQDAWNEGIKDTEFVSVSEKSLDLFLKRVSRPQKIKENGVFITICGEQLWYYSDETYKHIGEQVYVRYDPADPRTVRLYEMATDKYLWTWELADSLMMSYIEENLDAFADPNRRISAVKKALRAIKHGIIEAVDPDKRLDGFALMLKNGAAKIEESGGIRKPLVCTPIFAEEQIEEYPELQDIVQITSYMETMTANVLSSRKEG